MKRKYYKRCLYQYAYRFAPTGAIQPRREFEFKRRYKIKKIEDVHCVALGAELYSPWYFGYWDARVVAEKINPCIFISTK